MRSFISLVCAVEYIETHLRERISVSDVARASYLSLSHLQGMFSRTFHISVGDYVVKRKLCLAARQLGLTRRSITDIAFEMGYANVESFSRAFKKQFLQSPSVYRRENSLPELYPRLIINEKEGFNMIKRYDLTDISERILQAKGEYVICADIDHLLDINENIGRGAGDAAIARASARIAGSLESGMEYFRIGADHFIILTGSSDVALAESIAGKIISQADEEVVWSGEPFRFSVTMGLVKVPEDISDARETIERSEAAMIAAKKEGRNCYKVM